MDRLPIFILLLCLPSLNAAFELPYSSFWRRAQVPSTGYYDPKDTGGSMLTVGIPLMLSSRLLTRAAESHWDVPRRTRRAYQCHYICQLRFRRAGGSGDRRWPPQLFPVRLQIIRNGKPRSNAFNCRSLSFSSECLGQHQGNSQQANLGDGHGYRASKICTPRCTGLICTSERDGGYSVQLW